MHVKTPILLQSHATECGAASLGSVLAYFGCWVSLTELRDRCEVSRDGSSAGGIKRAAKHYGLDCVGHVLDSKSLKNLKLPLILYWECNHFVVFEGIQHGRYLINDPRSGHLKLTEEEFSNSYSSVALAFKPTPEFEPSGSQTNFLKQVPQMLEGLSGAFIQTFLCGLLLAIPLLMTPIVLALFFDRVLSGSENWGATLAAGLVGAGVISYLLTVLKLRWLKRLATRVSVTVGDRTVSRLIRLPIEFFNQRIDGDIVTRILSIDRVSKAISEHFCELLIEISLSIIFISVVFVFSPTLALVVFCVAVFNAILAYFIAQRCLDKNVILKREQGLLMGVGTLMLSQSDNLRLSALDDLQYARWSGHQAREQVARQELAFVTHINQSLPIFFNIVGHAVVLTFGAALVIGGELSLGTLVGLYIVVSLFLSPIGNFVRFTEFKQEVEADIQRISDISNNPDLSDDEMPTMEKTADSVSTLDGRLHLTGHVELKNITFGYNRSRPPLIQNFNLTIKPGQRVAIVGSSGSGKSTLARVVSGLYEPWSGEILFDGHPIQDIAHEILSRSISVVDQRASLFTDNVRNNITLWNPSVPDETVVAAARDACIHEEILNRPLGYATEVAENGSNFSGGQKQRLEIARALASEPVILILDEATSALDATTEQAIDHALHRRGLTCLIIAHRLSTIRDCNEIIVLQQGKEVERGTHDELVSNKDGLYYKLIQDS